MQKSIQYILGISAILLVLFFSLDIQKLDQYLASRSPEKFDADQYVKELWNNRIPEVARNAPELKSLFEMLREDPEGTCRKMGRKLGISSTWYFMTQGTGTIDSVREDYLVVSIDPMIRVKLATGFIFGNEIRDGSGVVNINDFLNMTDFNNVSVAINQQVKENVIPGLRKSARVGGKLDFAGAFGISEDHFDLSSIRIIPVTYKFNDETRR